MMRYRSSSTTWPRAYWQSSTAQLQSRHRERPSRSPFGSAPRRQPRRAPPSVSPLFPIPNSTFLILNSKFPLPAVHPRSTFGIRISPFLPPHPLLRPAAPGEVAGGDALDEGGAARGSRGGSGDRKVRRRRVPVGGKCSYVRTSLKRDVEHFVGIFSPANERYP